MIVYGSSLSPFVRKVLVFGAEKGLALESRPASFTDPSPEFAEASAFGKIPAFRDGDFTLSDSSAIVAYLDAAYPERPLIPAEPKARGRTIWFDEFADTILADCIVRMFGNRVIRPLLGRKADLAEAERAECDDLPPILDYLERTVPDDDGWLVGDALTLADIAVASPIANLAHMGLAIDGAKHPRTERYVDRILARPAFAELIAKETAFFAKRAAR